MKIKIKRFDKSLPLPSSKSSGAAALDLSCRLDIDIQPKEIAYIPMNIALQIPSNYFAIITPRSSTHKMGIQNISGIGIMDSDYCGDRDEYIFVAYNYTDLPLHITKGTRLCQLLLFKKENIEFQEVDKMEKPSRGGFGSTGIN